MKNLWLAASPDGEVHDPIILHLRGLVVCKAPFSLKE